MHGIPSMFGESKIRFDEKNGVYVKKDIPSYFLEI